MGRFVGELIEHETHAQRLTYHLSELASGGREQMVLPAQRLVAAELKAFSARLHLWRYRGQASSEAPSVIALFELIEVDVDEDRALGAAATEALADRVLDRIGEGFVLLDKRLRIARVNAAAAAGTEGGAQALLGVTCWEAWPWSDPKVVEAACRCTQAEDRAVTLEHRCLLPPRERWVELRLYPAADGGLVVLMRDITRRKHAAQRQAFFVALGDALRAAADPHAIVRAGCRALGEHLRVAQVGYGDVDPTQMHTLVRQDWTDGGPGCTLGRWRMEEFGAALVDELRAGRPVVVEDTAADPRIHAPESLALFEQLSARSVVVVPLVGAARLRAVLFLQDRVPRRWDSSTLELIEQCGQRVWAAAERTRAEQALAASEARFARAVAAARVGTWEWDAAGASQILSPDHEALYGRPVGSIASFDQFIACVHPEDRARVAGVLRHAVQASAGGDAFEDEYRVLWPDGSVRWLRAQGAVTARATDGRAQAISGVVMDVTERRAMEARLREREERLRLLLDSAEDYAIVMIDAAGGVAEWSRGAERLFGWTEQEALSSPLECLFCPEDSRAGVPAQALRAAREQAHSPTERWYARRDGTRFWGSGVVRVLADSERAGFVVILRDRTQERDAQLARDAALERLERADRQKDEFLVMLAHELRNPLAPITHAVQLIERAGDLRPAQAAAAQIVRRQSAHLSRLVDDLLEVSRVTRGRIALRREPFLAIAAIQSAVETVAPLVAAQNQALELDVPAGLDVVGDAVRLTQIVANLLDNATKYTPAGGRIALRARADEHWLEIVVADDGVGIDAELLPRIFDLFAQGDTSLDRSQGGLGIGLSLVRRLVELHGGTVRAESPGRGQGATFTVRLPRRERRASSRVPGEALGGAGA